MALASTQPEVRAYDALARRLRTLGNAKRLALLHFLCAPHHVEEVANRLRLTRQAAKRHIDELAAVGAVASQLGEHNGRQVTDYVLTPGNLYLICEEIEHLATLRAEAPQLANLTQEKPAAAANGRAHQGPGLWTVRGAKHGAWTPIAAGKGATLLVGRGTKCDVVLSHDPFVSTRHAQVRMTGDGALLEDLQSTNGTTHNMDPMDSGASLRLEHGDVIGIGRSSFVFWNR